MVPNAPLLHDPDPARLRKLMADAGITMVAASQACGVSVRTLERYLTPKALQRGHWCPYPLQFTLEALCWHRTRDQHPPTEAP